MRTFFLKQKASGDFAVGKKARALGLLLFCSGFFGCSFFSPNSGEGVSGGDFRHSLFNEERGRFREGLEIDEKVSAAHYHFIRGELATRSEDYEEALKHYQQAAQLEQTPAPILRQRLAELFIRDGKLEEALAEIDLGLKDNENDFPLLQLRAGVLATLQRVDESVAAYRKLIAINTENRDEPYVLLASIYAQSGALEEATRVLNELIKKKPDSVLAHYYLARVQEAGGKLDEALKSYKAAGDASSTPEAFQIELARVHGVKRNYVEAIRICQEILKNDADNLSARKLLSQLLLKQNKLDDALKEFAAIELLEDDPTDTRFRIALIKLQQQDFAGAEADLSLVLAKSPDHSSARYYLGSTYARQKRVGDAVRELKKVPPEADLFIDSRVFASYLLQSEKQFLEAIEILRDALQTHGNEVRFLSLLSGLEREVGDYSGAEKTVNKLIAAEPDNGRHYFTLGVLYDELKEKEKSIKALRKSLELSPEDATALNYLGYTLSEQGDELDEAEGLIQRALKIEPNNGYYLDSLGWVYYQKGDYNSALTELQRAAALVPNDAVILEHLGMAKQKLGKDKEALETFRNALQYAAESDDKEVGKRLRSMIKKLEQKK